GDSERYRELEGVEVRSLYRTAGYQPAGARATSPRRQVAGAPAAKLAAVQGGGKPPHSEGRHPNALKLDWRRADTHPRLLPGVAGTTSSSCRRTRPCRSARTTRHLLSRSRPDRWWPALFRNANQRCSCNSVRAPYLV